MFNIAQQACSRFCSTLPAACSSKTNHSSPIFLRSKSKFKSLWLFLLFTSSFLFSFSHTYLVKFADVYEGDFFNANSITTSLKIQGTDFRFTYVQSSSTGNNVSGVLTYIDNAGNENSVTGVLSRRFTSGTTEQAFFLTSLSSPTVPYLFVLPSNENLFTTAVNYKTNSAFHESDLTNYAIQLPEISVQPSPASTCFGQPATLSVSANVGSSTITSYDWYSNTINSNSGGNLVSTHLTTSSTDTFSPAVDTAGSLYYYAIVTTTDSLTVVSDPALFTVNALPEASISGSDYVCHNEQPLLITFTGSGSTAPYTFHYTINGMGNYSITALSGSSVSLPVPTNVIGEFKYELTSVSDANCNNTASGYATIRVLDQPRLTFSSTFCANELPVTFMGHEFTSAGQFVDTLFSIDCACDTIRTIVVAVNPLKTKSIDTTVCALQFPISLLGNTYTAAGEYIDTVRSTSGGCDTLRTIRIATTSFFTKQYEATIYASQTPYTYLGHVFTHSEQVVDTVGSSTGGCDTIRTIDVVVKTLVPITIDTTVYLKNITYNYLGHTFVGSSQIIDTVNTTSGLTDTVRTINVTVIHRIFKTYNKTICSNELPFEFFGYVFNAAGIIKDTVSSLNGQSDTVRTIKVDVNSFSTRTIDSTVFIDQLPITILGHVFDQAGSVTDTIAGRNGGCDTYRTINLEVLSMVGNTIEETICANQLPYIAYGHFFRRAGTQVDTVRSTTGGYDTLRTITIIVNPLIVNRINVSICANELPYTYMGHRFLNSGHVSDTLASTTGGCDTVRTITVKVKALLTKTVDTVICQNQLPFNFLGHVFYTSGTIVDTVNSSTGGCDTVRIINVSTISHYSKSVDTTVCENQIPLNLFGHSFVSSGSVVDTIGSTTGGCDTVRTINVVVTHPPTKIVDTVVCPCSLPLNLLGYTFHNAGQVIDTVSSTTGGCDTTRIINVFVHHSFSEFIDTTVCASLLPINIHGHLFNGPGSVTDWIVSETGAKDTVRTITVRVSQQSTQIIDTTVCANALPISILGDTYTASGQFIKSINSVTGGCDTLITINIHVTVPATISVDTVVCENRLPIVLFGHRFISAGQVVDTLKSLTGGCDTIITINVGVSQLTTSVVDTTVCGNNLPFTIFGHLFMSSGQITDTIVGQYGNCDEIRVTNVHVIPVKTTFIVDSICQNLLPYTWNGMTYINSGTYEQSFASVSGCDSIVSLQLTVLHAGASVQYDTICSNAFPYRWNDMVITREGSYLKSFTTSNGCDSVATLNLAIRTAPVLVINNPDPICEPGIIDLTNARITAGSDPGMRFTYWMDSMSLIPITDPKHINQSGTYYIKTTEVNACFASKAVGIEIRLTKSISGKRYDTLNTQPNVPIRLTARSLGKQYSWFPGIGLDANFVKDPTFSYDREMEYTVTMQTEGNCLVVDTIHVTIQTHVPLQSDIFVPKAWTPNSDGHNDKLFPLTVKIAEIRFFRIFNRWGQLMFQTKEIGSGWDGVFKGQPQVIDAYTWTLEAVGMDGQYFRKAGNSVLIR